jgi:hypothetical protein
LEKVFGWFYIAINLGAFTSTILTPLLLQHYGSQVAFGVPGIFMALATLLFWMGRHRFAHIPPRGTGVVKDAFSGEGLRAILALAPIYLLVAVFWSLFDQTASAWVLQAEAMNQQPAAPARTREPSPVCLSPSRPPPDSSDVARKHRIASCSTGSFRKRQRASPDSNPARTERRAQVSRHRRALASA